MINTAHGMANATTDSLKAFPSRRAEETRRSPGWNDNYTRVGAEDVIAPK